jgi:hypothetical protein
MVGTPPLPQPPLLAPTLCQHTCIDIPKAAAAAADGDGHDNATNVNGGHPPEVGNEDVFASITTISPRPNEAPPPSSFVNTHLLGGFTSTCWDTAAVTIVLQARKPGTILSFSRYSHPWQWVEPWRNMTINRS